MRRFWPRSLFAQLVLAQLALLLVLALMLPTLVLLTLHQTANAYVAAQLRRDADTVVAGMAVVPRRTGDVIERLGPQYGEDGSRAYRIVRPAGAILTQGGVATALPPPGPTGEAATEFVQIGKLDIYRRALDVDGGPALLEVAQDRTRPEVIVDDVVATFLERVFWVVPLVFAASLAVALLLVARMTKHLRGVSEQADRMMPGARLATTGLPLEAKRLAMATNRALDRVEEGFARQSEFAASVAHELRTPLTLVTLRSDALPPTPERVALREAIDQASHVVSQLMELAAIEGHPPSLEPIDLRAVAQSAVAATAPLVFKSGRSIAMTDGASTDLVIGHAGLLHIAIANLIDNAIRHTPAGTKILVRVDPFRVTIEDDGPGILIDHRDNGDRYRSAGQQRSDSAGLGLSIVSRIMTAMQGDLTIGHRNPGASITLHLTSTDPRL